MTPEMERFIELLLEGDEEALVEYCKSLENCPNCGAPIKWEDNQIYCNVCKEFGLTEPAVIPQPQKAGIW